MHMLPWPAICPKTNSVQHMGIIMGTARENDPRLSVVTVCVYRWWQRTFLTLGCMPPTAFYHDYSLHRQSFGENAERVKTDDFTIFAICPLETDDFASLWVTFLHFATLLMTWQCI